jgi:hypothetical protein
MALFAKDVWVLTIMANLVLSVFLMWRFWYIHYQWLTISTVLAVAADGFLWICHQMNYPMYEVSRLITLSGIFFILNLMVIWEAKWLKDTTVEKAVVAQVILSVVALILKHEHYLWPAYYVEIFNRAFNLGVVLLFIAIFAQRSPYEPSETSA